MSSECIESKQLKRDVGMILVACLHDVALIQPTDPINYIAQWLYKYADSRIYYERNAVYFKAVRGSIDQAIEEKIRARNMKQAMNMDIYTLKSVSRKVAQGRYVERTSGDYNGAEFSEATLPPSGMDRVTLTSLHTSESGTLEQERPAKQVSSTSLRLKKRGKSPQTRKPSSKKIKKTESQSVVKFDEISSKSATASSLASTKSISTRSSDDAPTTKKSLDAPSTGKSSDAHSTKTSSSGSSGKRAGMYDVYSQESSSSQSSVSGRDDASDSPSSETTLSSRGSDRGIIASPDASNFKVAGALKHLQPRGSKISQGSIDESEFGQISISNHSDIQKETMPKSINRKFYEGTAYVNDEAQDAKDEHGRSIRFNGDDEQEEDFDSSSGAPIELSSVSGSELDVNVDAKPPKEKQYRFKKDRNAERAAAARRSTRLSSLKAIPHFSKIIRSSVAHQKDQDFKSLLLKSNDGKKHRKQHRKDKPIDERKTITRDELDFDEHGKKDVKESQSFSFKETPLWSHLQQKDDDDRLKRWRYQSEKWLPDNKQKGSSSSRHHSSSSSKSKGTSIQSSTVDDDSQKQRRSSSTDHETIKEEDEEATGGTSKLKISEKPKQTHARNTPGSTAKAPIKKQNKTRTPQVMKEKGKAIDGMEKIGNVKLKQGGGNVHDGDYESPTAVDDYDDYDYYDDADSGDNDGYDDHDDADDKNEEMKRQHSTKSLKDKRGRKIMNDTVSSTESLNDAHSTNSLNYKRRAKSLDGNDSDKMTVTSHKKTKYVTKESIHTSDEESEDADTRTTRQDMQALDRDKYRAKGQDGRNRDRGHKEEQYEYDDGDQTSSEVEASLSEDEEGSGLEDEAQLSRSKHSRGSPTQDNSRENTVQQSRSKHSGRSPTQDNSRENTAQQSGSKHSRGSPTEDYSLEDTTQQSKSKHYRNKQRRNYNREDTVLHSESKHSRRSTTEDYSLEDTEHQSGSKHSRRSLASDHSLEDTEQQSKSKHARNKQQKDYNLEDSEQKSESKHSRRSATEDYNQEEEDKEQYFESKHSRRSTTEYYSLGETEQHSERKHSRRSLASDHSLEDTEQQSKGKHSRNKQPKDYSLEDTVQQSSSKHSRNKKPKDYSLEDTVQQSSSKHSRNKQPKDPERGSSGAGVMDRDGHLPADETNLRAASYSDHRLGGQRSGQDLRRLQSQDIGAESRLSNMLLATKESLPNLDSSGRASERISRLSSKPPRKSTRISQANRLKGERSVPIVFSPGTWYYSVSAGVMVLNHPVLGELRAPSRKPMRAEETWDINTPCEAIYDPEIYSICDCSADDATYSNMMLEWTGETWITQDVEFPDGSHD